jgi:Domain of unknown function (DUF4440)
MTVHRRLLAVAALASVGVSALAALPAVAQDADKAAVAEAVSNLTKAMLAADKTKLEALTSPQLSYGHSSGVIQTQSVFVDVIASKKSVYKSIELSNQTIDIAGNNAIVRHNWLGESGPADGSKWSVSKIGILQVWQKDGAAWKLLARQAFARPAT